jgi:ring-1,2-phenylacetyl-CoA epoxidase subunit PaaC
MRQENLYKYTLKLGDDALIMGQRLSELCSKGPFLEEDLALTNIALDYVGRAQAFMSYAVHIENAGRDPDELAYRREEHEYSNHLLSELPNGDFAQTIAKLFYISVFDTLFFDELARSSDHTLSAIAAKVLKEVKYHKEHSAAWLVRLGDGTQESHDRMQNAVSGLWMYTGELFEMDVSEKELLSAGVSVDRASLRSGWEQELAKFTQKATLVLPSDLFMQKRKIRNMHTEHMGHLLAEMQYLHRMYPEAKW